MIEISARLIELLTAAKSVVFFSGAGISAESGVPTFRGEGGIWKKLSAAELANFNTFMRNPDLVWEWYQHRRQLMENTKPNAAHYAITKMQNYFPHSTVVTQNVDNLHHAAGSRNIFELHGNIAKNYCVRCRRRYDYQKFEGAMHRDCECGGMIRPDVVWFGEMLPEDQYRGAEQAAESCEVLFSIGTTGIVMPACNIPVTAKNHGAYIVEINISRTEQTYLFHEHLSAKAGEALSFIADTVEGLRPPLYEKN
jgi:NAD-dependent deacetylase